MSASATQQVTLRLNTHQTVAIVLVENTITQLGNTGLLVNSCNTPMLTEAFMQAIKLLQKAHDDYVKESQKTVQVAQPSDLNKILTTH